MKCKYCNGTGYNDTQRGAVMTEFPPCPWCGGSGYVKDKEQTTEEWFCQLSIEEKAKVLRRKTYGNGEDNKREEEGWEHWLKAEHQESPSEIPNAPKWDEWLKEEKMKCSRCGGVNDAKCEFFEKRECPYQPLLNEKWMKSLNTEDFAEAIFVFMNGVSKQINGEEITNKDVIINEVIIKWLKERHNEDTV